MISCWRWLIQPERISKKSCQGLRMKFMIPLIPGTGPIGCEAELADRLRSADAGLSKSNGIGYLQVG